MHDVHFFGGGWMMFFWWALAIAVTIVIIRYLFFKKPSRDKYTPLEILERKYAKGEIDKEEFEQRKEDLS